MKSLVVSLLLLAALPSSAAAFEIPSRVSVVEEKVSLADLVPGAPASWRDVALGRAPRPGGERVLGREWILQRARQVGAEEKIQIAGDVTLTRPGREVSREEVIQAVRGALSGRLASGERVSVLSVGLPTSVPEGALELAAVLPEGALPSPATVWVDVRVDGRRCGRGWVRFEVSREIPVLTLVRDMRRGEILSEQDLEVRAGPSQGQFLSDPSEAIGKQMVRSRREGTALTARDLESVPLVSRGDTVRLVARVQGISASTLGRALDTAGIGDRILVENLTSGRTVVGVLREGGVVDAMPAKEM